MSNSPIDLSPLALDRSSSGPRAAPRRRRVWTRHVLPIAILLGFLGLFGAAAGTHLLPQPSVQVVPVIVKRSAVRQAGTPLFQAAGWIEPRPTAISVPALAPGVIEELFVVEGQPVEAGEPIARLISIDAELDLRRAEATLAIREGELARAEAERKAAKVRLDRPVHLEVQLAAAQSILAEAQTELAEIPFLIDAAEAKLQFANRSLAGKQEAESAIATRLVQQAVSDQAAAEAELRGLRERQPNLQREVDALRAKVDALRAQRELLVEETRQLEEAEAGVRSARALRDEAKVRIEQAALRLQRNTVRAPITGRILRLMAAPGTRVMGLEMTAGQSSSTVVDMYDPDRLQVRADVRLEDVPLVQHGQPVEIKTASSAEIIHGEVLRATSTANVQKNTLEVKIALINPPPMVGPEMLVTATFMAPESAATTDESSEPERILVPSQLIRSGESNEFVWIVDADQRAQRRAVTLGSAVDGELVEVVEGLNVTSKLIASDTEQLSPGMAVEVVGEDRSIGVGRRP